MPQERLQSFLRVAQSLQVAGLVPLDEEKSEKKRTYSDDSTENSYSPKRVFTSLGNSKEEEEINEDEVTFCTD